MVQQLEHVAMELFLLLDLVAIHRDPSFDWSGITVVTAEDIPGENAVVALEHDQPALVPVGGTIRQRLTPVQSSLSLRVTTPESAAVRPSLVPGAESLCAEYGPVERAGVLTMSIGSEERVFAVNVDPAESDLAVIDESELVAALDRPVNLVSDPTTGASGAATQRAGRATELASIALFAVIALLLTEPWLSAWLGTPRDRAQPVRHS